ncbi:MAG: S9 family peptidase [Proteobacteria bacterium]|nr:S9 family peptidase [Pseudomonadota bacterium]
MHLIKRTINSLFLTVLLTGSTAMALEYPDSTKIDHIDQYHGKSVADPYRWLEDDVRNSTAVADWVTAENKVTFNFLEDLPDRQRIKQKLSKLWAYEKYGIAPPRHSEHFLDRKGPYYFSFRNDGLKNQSSLYVQDRFDTETRLLIDPNSWSDDGTKALSNFVPSPKGRYIAYGIQDSGSDWRTWEVMDTASGKLLDDRIQWLKFTSISWLPDESGFFYSRYPRPQEGQEFQSLNKDQKVYLHLLGTAEADDKMVFARPDQPDWGFGGEVSEDGRWLIVGTWVGTDDRNRVDVLPLGDNPAAPIALIDDFTAAFNLLSVHGNTFNFKTTDNAPRGRVIAIDITRPGREHWKEVIPQQDSVLTGIAEIGELYVAHYLKHARSQVLVLNPDGSLKHEVRLPGIGTANGFNGNNTSAETFYLFSSFNQPPSIYRYDVISNESRFITRAKVDFNPADYVVEQVFFPSKDGTKIPMFITYKKGLDKNGTTPTLLYGYGGFNISILPGFDPSRIAWVEMGGIYAVANLRGGGEYGEDWHKAGTKANKQNVFDDFAAAAEFLIDQRWTSAKHLAIYGRSNGGTLIGATINQRPELFAAALPQVGVMDMLRFQNFTAGRFWTDDYGSSAIAEEFPALYAYSPYHNIKQGQRYPATMITTGDTDDRVVPGHSFKYAARLQQAQAKDGPPTLIRVDVNAGHADGKPTEMIIEEYADMWAFIAYFTGLKLPEGF